MKKQRRIRPRFGLRSILLLTTLIAVICGGWLRQAQMQRFACERLEEFGIKIELEEPRWWLSWLPKPVLSFGDGHYFCEVSIVSLHVSSDSSIRWEGTPYRNDLLTLVAELSSVKKLWIDGSLVDPTDFPLLANCRKLEELRVHSTELADVDFERLPRLPSLKTLDLAGGAALSGRFINVKRFPNLRELDCSRTQLNDETLREIGRFTELRQLDLSFTKVTDKGVAAISSLKKLELVGLMGTRVTGIGLGHLSTLRSVDVSQTDLDDVGLNDIAGLPKLMELDLSECVFVTDAGIRALANHGSLSSINASGCGAGLTDASNETLATIDSLENLSLGDTAIRSIAAFAACRKLSWLQVSSSEIPIDDALRFSEKRNACRIFIEDPLREFEPSARQLSSFRYNVRYLTTEELSSMAGESVGGNSETVYLEGLDGLKTKHIQNFSCDITRLDVARSKVDSDVFKYIRNWPRLIELDARRSSVSNDDLRAIGELRTLSILGLDGTNIDDDGISKIESLTDLQELSLGKTHLTPACLNSIIKLPKLTSLTLPFVPDAASLTQLLVFCRNLTEIKVIPVSPLGDFCQLDDCQINVLAGSELQLGSTELTPKQLGLILEQLPSDPFGDGKGVAGQKLNDEHCVVLANFTDIAKLDLSGSEVTDIGIGQLAKLPDLHSLNIANTNVTAVGLRSLQANEKLSSLVCAAKSWTVEFVDALFQIKSLTELSLPFSELPREVALAFAINSSASALDWYESGPDWEKRLYCSGTDWLAGIAPFDPKPPVLMLVGALIDDAKVDQVVSSPTIQHVWVKSVRCSTEPLMAKLLSLANATHMSLSGVALSPHDIGRLHELRQLEFLKLENCSLTNLHMAELAKLQGLSTLIIACDGMEPHELAELTKLTRLRNLVLQTKMQTEKYLELQRNLGKRCEIVRLTR
jgi:Leucine-rich repeat (LRR) protein